MRRLSFSCALLVVIFGGASGCSDHPVTPSPSEPDDRIIAFSSDSGASRGFSIFVMHADGSHTARLTDGGGAFDSFPTWSHDGQMITFDSDRSGGAATAWAMNADGSDVHFLADGYGARWSPDGTKLIYTGKASDNNWVVYIANADGSSPVRLTTNPRGEVRPAWSPDGAHLVYSAYPAEDMNLYVVNADGTGERQLTHTTGFSEDAMWSPDGTRIAFAHGLPNELAAVHVINIDGTNDQTLTALGCDKPSWSPDSRQIAYQCTIGQPPRLYRMNADGSAKRVLTTSGVFSVGPSWKPVP